MDAPRRLIVNADDFGLRAAVNAGVVEAHERGIVTSASLMVGREAAAEAAAYARANRALGVGLHVDLGEWSYDGGAWVALFEVAEDEIEAEVARQLGRFEALVGRLPTHLDSHQHVHLREPARSAVAAAGNRLGIPVRHLGRIAYVGDFYGQTDNGEPLPDLISAAALVRLLDALPPGTTEVACHPARGEVDGAYGRERELELAALCAPEVRRALDTRAITLCSFDELR